MKFIWAILQSTYLLSLSIRAIVTKSIYIFQAVLFLVTTAVVLRYFLSAIIKT